jgi:hypothetical protein
MVGSQSTQTTRVAPLCPWIASSVWMFG